MSERSFPSAQERAFPVTDDGREMTQIDPSRGPASGPNVARWRDHGGPVIDAKDGFDVVACERCGFRHVVPLPTPEELASVYRHDYYTREKPLYLERHAEDRAWWDGVYRRRYEQLEALRGGRPGRLLDVGCGPGFFLRHGADRGWDVHGVEPSEQAAAHARGLGVPVRRGVLDRALAAELGAFDVVHVHQVLEHVPDPAEILRIAGALLAPDGLLFVSVPNDYSPLQRHAREHLGHPPWWVVPPHHLNYFDRASLGGLLARVGFEVVHETTTFPMEVFLLMGERYVGDDALGRRVHGMRKALEDAVAGSPLEGALQTLYEALFRHDIGRECVVVARQAVSAGAATTADAHGGKR